MWATESRFKGAARLFRLAHALLVLVAFGTAPLRAQPFRVQSVPPASQSPQATQSFKAKVDEAARALANEPRLMRLSPQQRQALVEFVVGKVLFAATHEMGLALISEMALPVLGQQALAADQFAILTALKHGEHDFSDRVLIEAAKALFTDARRDKKQRHTSTYFGTPGLAERRSSQIACLMVGADPVRFKTLAEETKLPHDRRRTCGWEYDTVSRKWEKALAPYRRADQPKQKIEVIYGDARGTLGVYAQAFRALRFLETIAELAADRFVWRAPIVMEMRGCGASGAKWTVATRTLQICYEMVRDLAKTYRNSGHASKARRRMG